MAQLNDFYTNIFKIIENK